MLAGGFADIFLLRIGQGGVSVAVLDVGQHDLAQWENDGWDLSIPFLSNTNILSAEVSIPHIPNL